MTFFTESGIESQIKDRFSKDLDLKIPRVGLEPILNDGNSEVFKITQGDLSGKILKVLKETNESDILSFALHIDATHKLTSWPALTGIPHPKVAGMFEHKYACVESFVPDVIGLKNSKILRLPKIEKWGVFVKLLEFLEKAEDRGVVPVDIKLNDFSLDSTMQKVGFVDFGRAYVQGSSFNVESKKEAFKMAKLSLNNFIIKDLFNGNIFGGDNMELSDEVNTFSRVLGSLQTQNPEFKKK